MASSLSGIKPVFLILAILLIILPARVDAFGAGSMFVFFFIGKPLTPLSVYTVRVEDMKVYTDTYISFSFFLRHRIHICNRREKLASWRYRGYAQDGCVYQGSQVDEYDDQEGLFWELVKRLVCAYFFFSFALR